MSHVTTIKSEFKDEKALEAAIRDVFGSVERNVEMQAYMTSQNAQVALCVRKKTAYTLADLGWRRDGEVFAVVADGMDLERQEIAAKLQALRQRYSYHVTVNAARTQGYTVREEKAEAGAIKLTLNRY